MITEPFLLRNKNNYVTNEVNAESRL